MKILDCQKERNLSQFLCVPIGRYLVELTCERSCDLYRDVILQIGCELIWRGWIWWWRRDTTGRIGGGRFDRKPAGQAGQDKVWHGNCGVSDRKSTRLNSSH